MKPTNFFTQKAESFLEKLNNIKLVEYNYSISNDIYGDTINGDNSEYDTQSELLNDIKFQIKLMFSEFDNGNLFSQRIENFKTKTIFKHNFEEHENLKKVTELFIEFLKEYRN
jgi:hypothetical protein